MPTSDFTLFAQPGARNGFWEFGFIVLHTKEKKKYAVKIKKLCMYNTYFGKHTTTAISWNSLLSGVDPNLIPDGVW